MLHVQIFNVLGLSPIGHLPSVISPRCLPLRVFLFLILSSFFSSIFSQVFPNKVFSTPVYVNRFGKPAKTLSNLLCYELILELRFASSSPTVRVRKRDSTPSCLAATLTLKSKDGDVAYVHNWIVKRWRWRWRTQIKW